MLDVPSGSRRAASSPGAAETISLGDLKDQIAALEAEANSDSAAGYRACIEFYYYFRRVIARHRATVGVAHIGYSIDSGLPAGTVVFRRPTVTKGGIGRQWLDGPDKELVEFRIADVDTSIEGGVKFTGEEGTARPLPAGTYEYRLNWLPGRSIVCADDKDFSFIHDLEFVTLTVTAASALTLHEAFFDPVDIGNAVGADGTNGVLSPAAFSDDGATTTISSLKWDDGTVTLAAQPCTPTLPVPTGSTS